ncbi:MAG: beta/alpha barrel domain-containing protein, partial [Planctomycetota bacterium]
MAEEHAQPGGPAVDPGVIRITEVGARDGLQNEAAIIDIADKVRFIDLISESGVAEIEVSSFVSPRWVPQLADADEVFRRIRRRGGVGYSALVPNELGAQRALEANVDKIAVMTAASETFSRKNTNATIEQTMQRAKAVI